MSFIDDPKKVCERLVPAKGKQLMAKTRILGGQKELQF